MPEKISASKVRTFLQCARKYDHQYNGGNYPPPFSRLNPESAIMSLITWSIRYGIYVYFADNRQMGNLLTQRILEKYWKQNFLSKK